jgi:hypothetical protein
MPDLERSNSVPVIEGVEPELAQMAPFGLGVVAAYASIAQRPDLVTRAVEQVRVTADFARGKMHSGIYDPSALMTVGKRLNDPRYSPILLRTFGAAQQAFAETNVLDYSYGILSDASPVTDWVSRHKFDPIEHKKRELIDALTTTSDRDVPAWMWKAPSGLANPKDMLQLLRAKEGLGVNIETVMFEAISLLMELRKPRVSGEQLLQKVVAADAIFGPMAEIAAFDGLAMAVRSEAARNMFEKIGKTAIFDRAFEIVKPYSDNRGQVISTVESLLGRVTGGSCQAKEAFGDDTNHGIVFMEAELGLRALSNLNRDVVARATARVKSPGSLAKKILGFNASNEEWVSPADVLAATIIVNNYKDLAVVYADMVKRILEESKSDNPEIIPNVSPSRTHLKTPFHIKGDLVFRQLVLGEIRKTLPGLDPESLFDVQATTNGFTVAKATVMFRTGGQEVPIEVQVMTAADRKEARLGASAHIGQKSGRAIDPISLREINMRVTSLYDMTLTSKSERRARSLKARVENAGVTDVERRAVKELIG